MRTKLIVFKTDSAYHFTSAATLTLRCALEAHNVDTARECVANAKRLLDFLRDAKDEANWDLADICLAQCETVVEKLCDEDYLSLRRRNPHVASGSQNPDNVNRVNAEATNFPVGVDVSQS
jgi:hypothetical protein